ncbi:hypothetical protein [Haloferula sp.]|uniref:hypothetical protein n=1 Tax=Haloferula sp. TaxID=2497595 RepID=UPI00329B124C
MKTMGVLGGWLVTLLGSLGVLLGLGGIAGVWLLSQRATDSVDTATKAVVEFTSTVQMRAEEAGESVADSRSKLEELQSRIDTSIGAKGIDPEELRAGIAELKGYVEKLNDWIALASSTSEFMALLDGILGSVEAVGGAENRAEVAAAMTDGIAGIREASDSLEELQVTLNEAQAGLERSEIGEEESLISKCADTLTGFESQLGGFVGSVERAENGVEKLRSDLTFRIHLFAWVMSVLLIWQGVAQLCLARWGWSVAKR